MQKEEIEELIDKKIKDFFVPMAEGLRSIAHHLNNVTNNMTEINDLSDSIMHNTNDITDVKDLYVKLEDNINSISRKVNYLVDRLKPMSSEV